MILSCLLGVLLSIQSVINTSLREVTGNPIVASTINFIGGLLTIIAVAFGLYLLGGFKLSSEAKLTQSHWWMWMGGPLGIIFVTAGAVFPTYIGYGAFFSMLVTGELIFSAMSDHKGWLGSKVHPLDVRRAIGILLLLTGAVFVQGT